MKLTAKKILSALRGYAANHKYILINTYIFNWESDFFSVTKTGTVYEYEVKVSKADFKKDFDKRKHFFLKNYNRGVFIEFDTTTRSDFICWAGKEQGYADNYNTENKKPGGAFRDGHYEYCNVQWHDSKQFSIPAKFYYVCPEGLLSIHDLPNYAGLILITKEGWPREIKKAPMLHKKGLQDLKLVAVLMEKFYYLSERMRWALRSANVPFKEDEGDKAERQKQDV